MPSSIALSNHRWLLPFGPPSIRREHPRNHRKLSDSAHQFARCSETSSAERPGYLTCTGSPLNQYPSVGARRREFQSPGAKHILRSAGVSFAEDHRSLLIRVRSETRLHDHTSGDRKLVERRRRCWLQQLQLFRTNVSGLCFRLVRGVAHHAEAAIAIHTEHLGAKPRRCTSSRGTFEKVMIGMHGELSRTT